MSQEDCGGDFRLPEWIEASSEYEGREIRARFEARALSLAKQAFWLALFEALRAHPAAAGVRFTHERKAERMMVIEGAPGASVKAVAAAQKALGAVRGKFTGSQSDDFQDHLRRVTARGAVLRLGQEDEVLARALGAQWAMRRKSAQESRALREAIPSAGAQKSAGRL